MANAAYVFLNGHYHRDDRAMIMAAWRRERPRPLLLAVDGGLSFMQKVGLKPHFWLTDLDSAPRIKKGFLQRTRLLLHPRDKDKTDAELALDFCLQNLISDITFFGWYDRRDETDHLLGNLMLVQLLTGRRRLRCRFRRSRQEIHFLRDESMTFTGSQDFRLSVLPLSRPIRLNLRGTKYPARNLIVRPGQTIALRNRITAKRAGVAVKGAALVLIAK